MYIYYFFLCLFVCPGPLFSQERIVYHSLAQIEDFHLSEEGNHFDQASCHNCEYSSRLLALNQPPSDILSKEATLEEKWKKEDSILFHTIQGELQPLLEQHISQKKFDDDYVQRSALRFINLLDPEKRYFLAPEVSPYFSSDNTFSIPFRKTSLTPFWELFLMKYSAVHRAQMMRKALIAFLSSHTKECSALQHKKSQTDTFAQDEDELLLYQTDLLLSYLPSAFEKTSQNWKELLGQADKTIGSEEQEWSEVPNDSPKAFSLFHSILLKAFTKALDTHSEILEPKEAEELKEALTKQEGTFQWEIVDTSTGALLVLSLDCFYRGKGGLSAENDIRRAWSEANAKKPIRGVLLDLRKNRGGFLLEAVKVAGLFIKSGIIVVVEYSDGSRRYFRDLDPNVLIDCPTVVLTTKYTASAAEIVAQALRDYGVGVIVGDDHTYGKGSVQMQTVADPESTEGESSTPYKVTIGEFYGVSGETPQLQGVPADIIVQSYYSLFSVGERFMESGLPEPQKKESFFHDSLTDISTTSLAWYRKYYIPFLQEPHKEWKSKLPLLRKRSLDRRMKDSFWRAYASGDWKILQRFVPKDDSLEGFFEEEQKKEALSILQDMMKVAQNKHTQST